MRLCISRLVSIAPQALKSILERSGGVAPTWEDLAFVMGLAFMCLSSSSGRQE